MEITKLASWLLLLLGAGGAIYASVAAVDIIRKRDRRDRLRRGLDRRQRQSADQAESPGNKRSGRDRRRQGRRGGD